jgi:hypothetical protein
MRKRKAPRKTAGLFLFDYRERGFFAHDLVRKPEDYPRIKSEGKLFGIMRYPFLAGLAATYSSKP